MKRRDFVASAAAAAGTVVLGVDPGSGPSKTAVVVYDISDVQVSVGGIVCKPMPALGYEIDASEYIREAIAERLAHYEAEGIIDRKALGIGT